MRGTTLSMVATKDSTDGYEDLMTNPRSAIVIGDLLGMLLATGEAGFEGLVADLCEACTGQRFKLSGSGSQGGLFRRG